MASRSFRRPNPTCERPEGSRARGAASCIGRCCVASGRPSAAAPGALFVRGFGSPHPPAGADVDAGAVTLLRGMLDKGNQPARHESSGSHRRPATRHLGDLDDAARGRDLDPPAGTRGHDLEVLDALTGVDHGLHPIAFHAVTIARRGLRVVPHWPTRGDGYVTSPTARPGRRRPLAHPAASRHCGPNATGSQ